MDFNHPQRFIRLRARKTSDPYTPSATVDDWTKPADEIPVYGALSSASSRRTPDANREPTTSGAYLTVTDPYCDILIGDRIRTEPDDGRLWDVTGFPSNDINPFTGWQPTREIQLTERRG